MRFTRKPYPKHLEVRYKVFFAWLPVTIGLETRWLEKVSVKQVYSLPHGKNRYEYWQNEAFEQQPIPDFKHTSEPPIYIDQDGVVRPLPPITRDNIIEKYE